MKRRRINILGLIVYIVFEGTLLVALRDKITHEFLVLFFFLWALVALFFLLDSLVNYDDCINASRPGVVPRGYKRTAINIMTDKVEIKDTYVHPIVNSYNIVCLIASIINFGLYKYYDIFI